jgi:hypothetical protein
MLQSTELEAIGLHCTHDRWQVMVVQCKEDTLILSESGEGIRNCRGSPDCHVLTLVQISSVSAPIQGRQFPLFFGPFPLEFAAKRKKIWWFADPNNHGKSYPAPVAAALDAGSADQPRSKWGNCRRQRHPKFGVEGKQILGRLRHAQR